MAGQKKTEAKKTATAAKTEKAAEHKHAAPKPEAASAAKPAAKAAGTKAEAKVSAKPKTAKAAKKSRKAVTKKSPQVLALRRKVLGKGHLPVFRGRFGSRSIRKKANPKWNKWRFPRGLDVNHELSEGFNPRGGYGTDAKIRHVHPSGHREFMVRAIADLEKVPAHHAARIAGTMGSRKKMALVDKAIEKGIKVLNP